MHAVTVCTLKQLPPELRVTASERALRVDERNGRLVRSLQRMSPDMEIPKEQLAILVGRFWGGSVRLTVSFLDNPAQDLRSRILAHMNAWQVCADVTFVETAGTGHVRIARQGGDDGGYWSYLGTDILHIAADQPTLNLEGFTMNTDESEFVRVVRHETGHTMGFPHEHLRHEIVERIDREKAIAYYRRMFGWEPDKTIRNVLTALDESALIATSHADPTSIMCYWLPAEIMKDGVAVPGGSDIDVADMEFAKSVYPVGRDRFAVRRGNQVIFQERMSDVVGHVVGYGNGNSEDQYFVGDWTGDGKDKLAVRRGNQIIYQTHITDTAGTSVGYGNGNSEDQYLVGDWTGDGKDKLAVRRGNQIIYQKTITDAGGIAIGYGNGNSEDQYLVGDWTGDGKDKVAVRRGNQIIYQRSITDTAGTAVGYGNGNSEDQYLVGDWTGDGKDKLAVRRGNVLIFQRRLSDSKGIEHGYGNGRSEDQYLAGAFRL